MLVRSKPARDIFLPSYEEIRLQPPSMPEVQEALDYVETTSDNDEAPPPPYTETPEDREIPTNTHPLAPPPYEEIAGCP